jgi:hypothetical protein
VFVAYANGANDVLLFIGRMCDRKAFELARKIDARVDAREAAEKLAGPRG